MTLVYEKCQRTRLNNFDLGQRNRAMYHQSQRRHVKISKIVKFAWEIC